jgi:hypothetical protein
MSRFTSIDISPSDTCPGLQTVSTSWQRAPRSWTADGQELVFGAEVAGFYNLWRVAVGGGTRAERIEMAGFNARKPSLVADRMVFGRWSDTARIYRYRLTSSRSPDPVSISSAHQRYPALSPDGRHVSFCYTQTGRAPETWLAGTDGSNARLLAPGCDSAWRLDGQMLEENRWWTGRHPMDRRSAVLPSKRNGRHPVDTARGDS